MDVLKAGEDDLNGLSELLDYYAAKGVLTPRTENYVKRHLSDFYVCKNDGKLVGCCALHGIDSEVVEVRCFAVAEEFKGKGVGNLLLDSCLREARGKRFKRVFTLTLEADFFRKNGFTRMSKLKIPLATFKSEPETDPLIFARWMMLFTRMLLSDCAYEIVL